MSLNNIHLSAQTIAQLYPDSLVELATEKKQEPTPSATVETFKSLGKNQRNILVLVAKNNVAFLEDSELAFLSNVLAACKLSIADVAIVNYESLPKGTSYQALIQHFNSTSFLLFDVPAQSIDLPFDFPYFQLQSFSGCTYLSAPALITIEKEKALKAQLWACLKNLFCL